MGNVSDFSMVSGLIRFGCALSHNRLVTQPQFTTSQPMVGLNRHRRTWHRPTDVVDDVGRDAWGFVSIRVNPPPILDCSCAGYVPVVARTQTQISCYARCAAHVTANRPHLFRPISRGRSERGYSL